MKVPTTFGRNSDDGEAKNKTIQYTWTSGHDINKLCGSFLVARYPADRVSTEPVSVAPIVTACKTNNWYYSLGHSSDSVSCVPGDTSCI
jgi:hypothetical protein